MSPRVTDTLHPDVDDLAAHGTRMTVTVEIRSPEGEVTTYRLHDLDVGGGSAALYVREVLDDEIRSITTRPTKPPTYLADLYLAGRLLHQDGETHRITRDAKRQDAT